MVEFPVLGDCSVEDLVREVIRTDVPTNGDGVPSKSFNFLNDELGFLLVKAVETDASMNVVMDKAGQTHSLTTTFAPSLAKMIAALLPIPYEKRVDQSTWRKGLRRGINEPEQRLGYVIL